MSSTILATFDSLKDAHHAIEALTESGFKRSDIGLAVYDAEQTYSSTLNVNVDSAEGSSVGATFGSIFGAVLGLVTITIPGIGPVIAAGPLAIALGAASGAGIGAVSGAITGGIVARLVDMGIPVHKAHFYAESLRQGAALVSVTAYESDANRAMYILQTKHPVDIDKRVSQWRMRGWTEFDASLEAYEPEALLESRKNDSPHTDSD